MKLEKGTFGIFPAAQCKGLDPYTQLIFVWLCYHTNKDGVCFPSLTKLSQETNIGKRTIIRRLQDLEDLKFITKKVRQENNRYLSNIYEIHVTSSATETPLNENSSVSQTLGWCQTDTTSSVSQTLGVVSDVHPNKTSINQTSITKPLNQKKIYKKENTVQNWFDKKFWPIYPLKKARQKANEAILKLNPDEDLMFKIENAINLQITERNLRLKHKLFVSEWPLPGTWIKGERWTDEVCINEEKIENATRNNKKSDSTDVVEKLEREILEIDDQINKLETAEANMLDDSQMAT